MLEPILHGMECSKIKKLCGNVYTHNGGISREHLLSTMPILPSRVPILPTKVDTWGRVYPGGVDGSGRYVSTLPTVPTE